MEYVKWTPCPHSLSYPHHKFPIFSGKSLQECMEGKLAILRWARDSRVSYFNFLLLKVNVSVYVHVSVYMFMWHFTADGNIAFKECRIRIVIKCVCMCLCTKVLWPNQLLVPFLSKCEDKSVCQAHRFICTWSLDKPHSIVVILWLIHSLLLRRCWRPCLCSLLLYW